MWRHHRHCCIMEVTILLIFFKFRVLPKWNLIKSSVSNKKFLTCFWLDAGVWKLVPGPFMILMKWHYNEICHFSVVDIYHFYFSLIQPFKKMKHWKLYVIGYWVIGRSCLIKKDLEFSPSPPSPSKDFGKLLPLLISINCWSLVDS